MIGVLPFFHIYGLTVILNMALSQGATIVTMPRFDLEQFLQLLQDHKVTPCVRGSADRPRAGEAPDRRQLRPVELEADHVGGRASGQELSEAAAKRLDTLVIQGYGLTETSPVTHVNPEEESKIKQGSIGPLIPNTEAKVVDPASGKELGYDETGEVWIKGPQVMKGYLNNEEATEHTVDDDGYLHTGDIGYADQDGYFYIVDRLKELIKYKGFQVPPAELEAVLLVASRRSPMPR